VEETGAVTEGGTDTGPDQDLELPREDADGPHPTDQCPRAGTKNRIEASKISYSTI